MDSKQFKFEVKSLTAEGKFTGMASVFGNTDLGGDVVEPGAFTRTLAHKGGQVPILFAHDSRQPIGLGKLTETAKGLEISGELALEVEKAREVFSLLKRGILKGLSIGYDTVRDHVANGVRHLQELKLYEVSVVTFPMNEMATVTSVKADMGTTQIALFRETLAACTKSFR